MSEGEASRSAAIGLVEMMRAYQVSQALHVAVALRIADHLADGPKGCTALAQAAGVQPDALYRVMRTLASRGVFEMLPDQRFALNEMSQPLRSDIPGSVRAYLLLWGHPTQWVPWGRLLDSVRSGEACFEQIFGLSYYDYLEAHPEDAAMFQAAMANQQNHTEFAEAYDLSQLRMVVDVGGGNGRLLAAILQANPACQGVLLDRPSVAATAAEYLRQAGVGDRCRTVGGDFRTDIEAGGDAYVLSNVIQDQNTGNATSLLRSCAVAAGPKGKIIVMERMIPAGNAASFGHLSDLMCLGVTGGRVRSVEEFDSLFEAAGLRRSLLIDLPSGYSVIEACTSATR